MKQKINNLEEKLSTLKEELSGIIGKENLLTEQISTSEKKIEDFKIQRMNLRKAVELLSSIQKKINQNAKSGIEIVVTHALRYIFNEDYRFHLDFRKRGNLQELFFQLIFPGEEEPVDLMACSAGGVLDVISFALRIAIISLIKPKVEGFIVGDEIFRNLSTSYLPTASNFLQTINMKLKRQLILITHKQEFLNPKNNLIEIK